MATGLEPCGRFEWERVVRRADLPMRLKLVALTMATYADSDGSRVRPGVDALAAVTGQGESTVRRLVTALRESGFLELVARGGGRAGRGRAAEYRLTLPSDVTGLLRLSPAEDSPLHMESAQPEVSPLAVQSAQCGQSTDSPLVQESAQSGPSPVDNSESPLALVSAQSETPQPIDRSENTVTDRLTARYDELTARSSERLPSHLHQPPKSDQPSGHHPTQQPTARDTDPNSIELRPRNCAHGLPAHRDATGNPTCPLCRRGLPAKDPA